MKKLIVCCDGSWNTLEQEHDGVPVPTNVGKLYFSLENQDESGNEQLAYYHPGVGTNPGINDKFFGGAFGDGLDKNIMSAYRWICDHYMAGDQLYLFGFSRGAYTARSLGGFLTRCGVLDLHARSESVAWERIETAYKKGYRDRNNNWRGDWAIKVLPKDVVINFIGVWDTVGALGVPDTLAVLSLLDNFMQLRFHDTDLSEQVKVARHALAIDEKRASFSPTLWTNIPPTCDVKQVWFPGVHSDVGGGYPETGLSDGAFKWMLEEVTDKKDGRIGLKFKANKIAQIKPDYQDVLHDSYKGAFKYFGSQPRSIPPINHEDIHQSAKDRQTSPPITEHTYRPTSFLSQNQPTSLKIFAAEEWNQTGIYMQAGEVYEFAASGEWLDSNIKSGPDGSTESFHFGKLVHDGIDVLGKLEGLWQKATKNENANIVFTKREEEYEWFALIGVIANGGNPTVGGAPEKHEAFLIGHGCTYTVKKSGYFMAFANDAWNYYDNNRGSVKLVITKK